MSQVNVIILAAGKGSRVKSLPEGESKCSQSLSSDENYCSVVRLMQQCHKITAGSCSFTVVVGHGSQGLVSKIKKCCDSFFIKFVYNHFYETHGCGISFLQGFTSVNPKYPTIVLEGDSVFSDAVLIEFIRNCSPSYNYSLVRDSSKIKSTSVVTISDSTDCTILRYLYDQTHQGSLGSFLLKDETLHVRESMQLWYFGSQSTYMLWRYCHNKATEIPKNSSGVFLINRLIASESLKIIERKCHVSLENDWINLNTDDDFNRARRMVEEEKRLSYV